MRPKGEVLAWYVFGGIAFIGFLASFIIGANSLESEGLCEDEGTMEDADDAGEGEEGYNDQACHS